MKRTIIAGTVGVVAGFIAGAAAIINYEVEKRKKEEQHILDTAYEEFTEEENAYAKYAPTPEQIRRVKEMERRDAEARAKYAPTPEQIRRVKEMERRDAEARDKAQRY